MSAIRGRFNQQLCVRWFLYSPLALFVALANGCSDSAKPGTPSQPAPTGASSAPLVLDLVQPASSAETSATGIELILIQPGRFLMGAPDSDAGAQPQERPQHIEGIKDPFYLGKYEVTQQQYQSIMDKNPSWFCAEGTGQNEVKGIDTARFPVEQLSWYDSLVFLNALSERENFTPYYAVENPVVREGAIHEATVRVLGGAGYRLPTEAEWEYACRAGTSEAWGFSASSTELPEYAVFGYLDSGMRVHQTGEKKPNPLGLSDMQGNVAELCANAFEEDAYANPRSADESVSASHRVIRGGSWFNGPLHARCSARYGEPSGEGKNYVGLRVARSGSPVSAPGAPSGAP